MPNEMDVTKTGNWKGEWESGNECTEVHCNLLKNSKWRTKEKKRVWQLVLSTRSSNAIVGANSMDGKCRFY